MTLRRIAASRLFGSTVNYVKHQLATIVRTYAMYEPLRVFTLLGVAIILVGLLLVARFLYFYLLGYPGLVQSLTIGVGCLIVGFQVMLNGLLADLIAANRRLLEDALYRLRRAEVGADLPPEAETIESEVSHARLT